MMNVLESIMGCKCTVNYIRTLDLTFKRSVVIQLLCRSAPIVSDTVSA